MTRNTTVGTPPSSMRVSHKLSTEVGIQAGLTQSLRPMPKIGWSVMFSIAYSQMYRR